MNKYHTGDAKTDKLIDDLYAQVSKATADNWVSVCSLALTKYTKAASAVSRQRSQAASAKAVAAKPAAAKPKVK